MKKVMVSVFLLVSVCNADVGDDTLAVTKKYNMMIPTQRLSSVVPPCPGDMAAYSAVQRAYNNAAQVKRADKSLSGVQEIRRCP